MVELCRLVLLNGYRTLQAFSNRLALYRWSTVWTNLFKRRRLGRKMEKWKLRFSGSKLRPCCMPNLSNPRYSVTQIFLKFSYSMEKSSLWKFRVTKIEIVQNDVIGDDWVLFFNIVKCVLSLITWCIFALTALTGEFYQLHNPCCNRLPLTFQTNLLLPNSRFPSIWPCHFFHNNSLNQVCSSCCHL